MRWMLEGALRGLAAASVWAARGARSLRARVGWAARRDRADGPGAPQPRPEDAAFLDQVSETLRRIEASGETADAPRRRSGPGSARVASAVAWLRRWREPIRRHEDALLAAALLAGILVMVIHWLSGTGPARWQGSHGTRGADVQTVRPARPGEAWPAGTPGSPAARVGPTGETGRIDPPR